MGRWAAGCVGIVFVGALALAQGHAAAEVRSSLPEQVQACDREAAGVATAPERADASWYEEAVRLGVDAAVRATQLPERSQRRVAAAIVREARANGLDPLLVVALIRAESSFNAFAVSNVGALGLMQVMPDTGRWLLERRGERLPRSQHLFDPELNIELGTAYLAELVGRFGSVEKALVAYNAGPSAARRILAGPDRGQRFRAGYPRKVLTEYRRLSRGVEARADASGVGGGAVTPSASR